MGLRGLRVALTGGLERLSRPAFRIMLEEAGAVFAPSLDQDTDVLIVGTTPLASKVTEAARLGIRTMSGADAVALLTADEETTMPPEDAVPTLPSLALRAKAVRVLDIEVPRVPRGELTPAPDLFAHTVLDAPTLHLLRHLARAVVLRQPCLITGETATAKSSTIALLASLVGAQVVRVNLNGQTETGELVGRYVPDGAGWRFQEGVIPQAMRNGWWVILDEVNLAEPAVIERLNPVLERTPTLLLTEGPNTRFGPGGEPVHDGFRVFATLNPPRYVGRSTLSPAWRDRFTAQVVARSPGETEVLQLLTLLSSGSQPTVVIDGVTWEPGPPLGEPIPGLASLEPWWPRVASFFGGLFSLCAGDDPLGADQREPVVYSRRSVLAVVDALQHLTRIDPVRGRLDVKHAPRELLGEALRAATLERLASDADRTRVGDLLRSLDL